jgi:hypothetical protein
MNKMKVQILAAAVVAAVFSSCGGSNGGGEKSVNNGTFPMVNPPSYINDQEQAVRYIAKNFWDDFFKIELNGKEKAGAVHGVDSLAFLNSFGMYAQLATMVGAQTMEAPMAELFHNLDSLALAGERKPLLKVMEQMEHYFFDPNSPVLDEEMYLRALDGILACKSLQDVDKMQYEYQHRLCSLNRAGTPAADFKFEEMKGNKGSLYGIKGDYTLVFFNNPGCHACGEILETIVNSPVAEMFTSGKVKVLAMYIDEDIEAWRENRDKFPKEWIYAHDHKMILRDNNIYGLRAIPSLYLLDKEKRVILKDAPVGKVISYLQQQTI